MPPTKSEAKHLRTTLPDGTFLDTATTANRLALLEITGVPGPPATPHCAGR
ncbi:hypothetical protein ACFWUZ_28745 [Streptomyces sp. NPDC058646]|uniref:hypothetical protein n=1 Tax=Streptomyces sp. NPDC058646 TaxID=3346574 RepID=UPI003651161B